MNKLLPRPGNIWPVSTQQLKWGPTPVGSSEMSKILLSHNSEKYTNLSWFNLSNQILE